MSILSNVTNITKPVTRGLDSLIPALLLGTRLWVANVFFKSGLVKIQSFEATRFLFEYEYQVPLLSPHVAAYLGTFIELIFPVLLALGLSGRLSAFVLFVFNVIAVISYPALQIPGIKDHQLWGFMLVVLVFFGPGKLSVDHFLAKRLRTSFRATPDRSKYA